MAEADILALCSHDMTAGFCPECKSAGVSRHAAHHKRGWDGVMAEQAVDIDDPWTRAKYRTDCPMCGRFVEKGDVIGMREGAWVCEDCAAFCDEDFDDDEETDDG